MAIELPDNTHVRHKTENYHGWVGGKTRIRGIFTGNTDCIWQYRIKIAGQVKRKIAPSEDLEIFNVRRTFRTSYPTVYHFTDARNISSIRRLGLLSWKTLIERNIEHIPASNELSRELDQAKNLQHYVRLCINRNHPMATRAQCDGRVNQLVWLTINQAIFSWKSTLFCNKNAASNDAIISRDPKLVLNSSDPQAEILIENALADRWVLFP